MDANSYPNLIYLVFVGGAKLHKRYDLIVLDDFDDENNTLTPESRS